jgi:hypothetical protein
MAVAKFTILLLAGVQIAGGISMADRWKHSGYLLLALLLGLLFLLGCGAEPTTEPEATATPGMRFLMPTPGTPPATSARTPTTVAITYIVQAGDTLYDIALRYGVTVDEIVEANNLENPDVLKIGQELIIPLPEPTAAPVAPTAPPVAPTATFSP